MQRKFKDLIVNKDDIMAQYKEGIQGLKSYELHPNLWKDPTQK